MPIINGVWSPELFPKQQQLLRELREPNGLEKHYLLCGPKWSGKTRAAACAIVDHCWNTRNAHVAIITKTISIAESGGFWKLLVENIIPMWIEGDFGFEWAPKGTPRQSGVSKKLYCLVTNKYGGVSRIELNSIKEEREVESEFFGRYFTMIYVSEAAMILRDPKTYITLTGCFRVEGVDSPDNYVLLFDTNPADSGTDHFLYELYYVLRIASPDKLSEEDKIRRKYLRLLEIFPDENPYLTDEKKLLLRAQYSTDPDLYARYWLGLWKKARTGALFSDVFKPVLHVIGDSSDNDIEILVPEPECMELMTSWDFGPANPYVCFCEKVFHQFPGEEKERSVFKFFDEFGLFDEKDISLAEFTHIILERMDAWEAFTGRRILWKHYSDKSAFDVRESISNIYQYQEVFAASDQRIELTAVDKKPGSVSQAIRLWRKLLIQERLLFSFEKTPLLIEMNQSISAGKNGQPIAKGTRDKHPFDAARYLIMRECWQENAEQIIALRGVNKVPHKVIMLPL